MRERARLGPVLTVSFPPVAWLAVLGVLAVALVPLLPPLLDAWRNDPYAGHGMFVPVYSAFLAWAERERLGRVPRRGRPVGALVAVLGLALVAAGHVTGSLTVRVVAFVTCLAGVLLWSCGSRLLRAAAFPVAFLLFVMPLPRPIVEAITGDIQAFGATVASVALELAGVPHHRSGIVIQLPLTTLVVAEGCNGLRFLMALVTLTAAFAQATQPTVWRKLALVTVAIPLAIAANAGRVTALAFTAHQWGPAGAEGLVHHSIGKGVWALTLVPLVLFGLWLRRRPVRAQAAQRDFQKS